MLDQINQHLKEAMKAKDQVSLRSLRLIKATLMLLHTESRGNPSAEDEMAALIKMAKQRRDSIEIYHKEGRSDLQATEEEELAVIERYLPQQMGEEELRAGLNEIISETGADSMKDMGKVMGMATQKFKGMADGKLISQLVRELLS
ncbi:MAG: GatB/YqeY domain-containing protein [Bacteroidia bacterium]